MSSDDAYHNSALYIDVELTCWNGPPPSGMKQEIIEIGVVEMDLSTLKITREAAYFVRPRRWEVSDKCSKLTGITNEDIRTARPFTEIIAAFAEEFRPGKKLCGTWGEDAALIAQACHLRGLKTPLRNLLDVGHLFRWAFLLKQQVSLSGAIRMLDLQFDGVPHTALADARNTAHVHAAIIRRMRREPDPPPFFAEKPINPAFSGIFAEKLRQSLQMQEQEHSTSTSELGMETA